MTVNLTGLKNHLLVPVVPVVNAFFVVVFVAESLFVKTTFTNHPDAITSSFLGKERAFEESKKLCNSWHR